MLPEVVPFPRATSTSYWVAVDVDGDIAVIAFLRRGNDRR